MKIMIIGYSGSGKSTLAKRLGLHYHIPVLYLDTLNFGPNWVERPKDLRDQDLLEFLNNHSSWVIDGNYTGSYFERRMEEADQIIYLNVNRFVCLMNAWVRYRKYRNITRESMAAECNEKFDYEFFRWILWDGRIKSRRDRFRKLRIEQKEKVLIFKSRRALNRYLIKQKIELI